MDADHATLSPRRMENLLLVFVAGALCLAATWGWRGNPEAMSMALLAAAGVEGLRRLSKAGRTRLAALVFGVGANVITLVGVAFFHGPRGHAPAFLMVVVMFTGLLVGWRGGAASLLTASIYVFLDGVYGPTPLSIGKLATEPTEVTLDWLMALGLAGSLAVVSFHTTSRLLADARASEHEKRVALTHAQAASQAKSAFLANMSHELRTPLTAILGYAELLEDDLDGQQGEDAERIVKAGHHLLELIDQVLDMARVEAGKLDLHIEGVDLDDLLSDVVALVAPEARRRRSVIHTSWADLGSIETDPLRLRQILQNLLSNAIKYAPGRIDLEAHRDDGFVVLVVRDHGPGIPRAVLPTLFEPFSRGHSTSHEGTGLGLALSSSLATHLGGTLSVDSSSSGVTFRLTLPTDVGADVHRA